MVTDPQPGDRPALVVHRPRPLLPLCGRGLGNQGGGSAGQGSRQRVSRGGGLQPAESSTGDRCGPGTVGLRATSSWLYRIVPDTWKIARPTSTSVYASRNTSRCSLQDSRPGWIRYFLSCRALASPTTCRFIPALSGLPTTRDLSKEMLHVRDAVPQAGGSRVATLQNMIVNWRSI
jgi:hypothetical protein